MYLSIINETGVVNLGPVVSYEFCIETYGWPPDLNYPTLPYGYTTAIITALVIVLPCSINPPNLTIYVLLSFQG